jgi:hypothetical protein
MLPSTTFAKRREEAIPPIESLVRPDCGSSVLQSISTKDKSQTWQHFRKETIGKKEMRKIYTRFGSAIVPAVEEGTL